MLMSPAMVSSTAFEMMLGIQKDPLGLPSNGIGQSLVLKKLSNAIG
jgi:hypothetical protein